MQASLKQTLLAAACAPYRAAGRFHYHWAQGKLGKDPVFAWLLEQGLLKSHARVRDLGCGRGLLAAWFLAAERLSAAGGWQPGFPVATGLAFHGVDLQAAACAAGEQALQPLYGTRVSLQVADMCLADLHGYDAFTLLDVLHYISFARQDQLLDRIRAALPPGGVLITRVGNAGSGWRFRFSQWVDRWVARAHGHRIDALYCRTLDDWTHALTSRGFQVTAQAMSEGTPFSNVLLVARVP